MARCAIYCRVSTDEQAEKGNVQSQIEYAKKYLELHGPENNIDEFEFYIDEGVSGTIPLANRPAGAKLILDANKNEFTILFMYRLDRLARSVKHVLDTYELLESKGIALKSMTEAFDTSSPTGKFFMTLLASIAALERDTIRERTQMGKDRNARAGKWVSGLAPFGYRRSVDDGRLEIYHQESETVKMIFDLYNQEMTMVEIARYLNARGTETPATSKGTKNKTGGKWHPASISKILSADVYTGKYQYLHGSTSNRKNIEMDVPIIIDIEVFSDIQKKAKANADLYRGRKGRLYLLRGAIFCGHCGASMSGSSANGNKNIYYRCPNTSDLGQGKKCTSKGIRAVELENAVWKDILELANSPEKFQEYFDDMVKDNREKEVPLLGELLQVEEAILLKQKARGRILSMITRGVISDQEAETELQSLAIEIRSLNSRRENLFQQEGEIKSTEEELINSEIALNAIKKYQDSLGEWEKFGIIQEIVRRVNICTVNEDGQKTRNRADIRYSVGIVWSHHFLRTKDSIQNFYSIESTWEFQAFSKNGGVRIRWN